MENFKKWVIDNWSDIVKFFDEIWNFVKKIVEGDDAE